MAKTFLKAIDYLRLVLWCITQYLNREQAAQKAVFALTINFIIKFFRDNAMNINEFTGLIKALFRNEKGKPYPIDNYMITEIFNIFNKSGVSF